MPGLGIGFSGLPLVGVGVGNPDAVHDEIGVVYRMHI